MLTRTPRLLVALLVALVAVACTPEDSNGPDGSDGSGATEGAESDGSVDSDDPEESSSPAGGTSSPVGDEALGDDEVTLHMANPPELPSALEGAPVRSAELRTDDLSDRHAVQLVDVPADTTTLDEALPAGAVLRVPAGQTLEVDAAVDVALLDPDATEDDPGVIGEVDSPCASPCTAEGPALVTVEGWMTGFGIAASWQLLVTPPSG